MKIRVQKCRLEKKKKRPGALLNGAATTRANSKGVTQAPQSIQGSSSRGVQLRKMAYAVPIVDDAIREYVPRLCCPPLSCVL